MRADCGSIATEACLKHTLRKLVLMRLTMCNLTEEEGWLRAILLHFVPLAGSRISLRSASQDPATRLACEPLSQVLHG